MSKTVTFQVAIAGGGPGGSLLARDLARAGVSVAVFEENAEGAQGHNWSDAIEKNALAAAGFEMPAVQGRTHVGKLVKRNETDDNLFEPHVVALLQVKAPDLSGTTRSPAAFRYITTDRKVLNRMLLAQAKEAGATLFYDHRVDDLIGQTGGELSTIAVEGLVATNQITGKTFEVPADITVDAAGYRSKLRTKLSGAHAINRVFEGGDLAYACRTVRKIDLQRAAADDLTDHYRYGAFRGYFWTHRHFEDVIDVGGGVREEPGRVDPKRVIGEMIAQRPSITDRELRGGGGIVLVGRSPYSLAAPGFLAVGDAAGQVIPTTGCGVGGALVGAMLAAETIVAALQKGDTGLASLWPYNWKWFVGNGRGGHFAALSTLKEILQNLSHEELAFLMTRDILGGEMLTPTINGVFQPPGLADMIRTLVRGISRPSLLMKLNQATTMGRKIFDHYRKYPDVWDPARFDQWIDGAEKRFGRMKQMI